MYSIVVSDDVEVLDTEGNFVNSFPVGAIPGSFVFWNDNSEQLSNYLLSLKTNQ